MVAATTDRFADLNNTPVVSTLIGNPARPDCSTCGGTGWVDYAQYPDGTMKQVTGDDAIPMRFYDRFPKARLVAEVCGCVKEMITQRRLAKIASNPDIPQESLKYSFADFEGQERYTEALPLTRLLADGMEVSPGRPGLLLAGPTGTGKTTLASIVFRAWLESGKFAMWAKAITLIKQVQATYSPDYDGPSEDDIIDMIGNVPLLVIDDLGSKLPTGDVKAATENRVEILYRIIDIRETKRLPTLITTNLESSKELYDHLGQRIVSRLRGLCYCVLVEGADYRVRQ